MPKRQNISRYDSTEVQGPDSYVEIRRFTVAEAVEYRDTAKQPEFDEFLYGLDLIRKHVVSWNWVDNDDNPLPLPTDDPNAILSLTDREVAFISSRVRGNVTEQELGKSD